MARRNFGISALLVGVLLFSVACVKESADKQKSGQQNSAMNSGIIDFIKLQKLVKFPSTTIGQAFEAYRYASRKEWSVTPQPDRHIAVDFVAWFDPSTLSDSERKDGIVGKGLSVTFMINQDNSFYVSAVSKIATRKDGKVDRSQMTDIADILSKIYANERVVI